VGVYETYSDGVVATIDARGSACGDPAHRLHEPVDLGQTALTTPSTYHDQSTRV
jgi:hypothetical protein